MQGEQGPQGFPGPKGMTGHGLPGQKVSISGLKGNAQLSDLSGLTWTLEGLSWTCYSSPYNTWRKKYRFRVNPYAFLFLNTNMFTSWNLLFFKLKASWWGTNPYNLPTWKIPDNSGVNLYNSWSSQSQWTDQMASHGLLTLGSLVHHELDNGACPRACSVASVMTDSLRPFGL